MFIAAIFTIAKTWNQPKCPSADKWIKKMWCTHTHTHTFCLHTQTEILLCSGINKNETMKKNNNTESTWKKKKKNETMPFVATWVDLMEIMSEANQRKRDIIWYHLYVEHKKLYKWISLQNRLTDIKNKFMGEKNLWLPKGKADGGGNQFSSVQSLSRVWLFATPWTAAHQASLSITHSRSLLKLMSIKSVIPSNHLILCRPLLLLLSIFPSIRVFSNESVLCIRWSKYWSFNFSTSPSNEYSGLISFRIDWFDLLAVWGALKSLLQHHSSKASILQHSAFFMVQLSHPYMITGKSIALTRQILVSKVTCLLFNMLSRLVIAFLPRTKCLLISLITAVTICSDFGAPQYKVSHYFHCFPICLPWSDGTGCHDLSFLNVEF